VPLKSGCDFGADSRVRTPSFTPVSPVSIVRGCRSFDLRMALDGGFIVS
jgi:hypothetical protein